MTKKSFLNTCWGGKLSWKNLLCGYFGTKALITTVIPRPPPRFIVNKRGDKYVHSTIQLTKASQGWNFKKCPGILLCTRPRIILLVATGSSPCPWRCWGWSGDWSAPLWLRLHSRSWPWSWWAPLPPWSLEMTKFAPTWPLTRMSYGPPQLVQRERSSNHIEGENPFPPPGEASEGLQGHHWRRWWFPSSSPWPVMTWRRLPWWCSPGWSKRGPHSPSNSMEMRSLELKLRTVMENPFPSLA